MPYGTWDKHFQMPLQNPKARLYLSIHIATKKYIEIMRSIKKTEPSNICVTYPKLADHNTTP